MSTVDAMSPIIAALPDDALSALTRLINTEWGKREKAKLLAALRDFFDQTPEEYEGQPAVIVFPTDEWENGRYFTTNGAMLYLAGGQESDPDAAQLPLPHIDGDGCCIYLTSAIVQVDGEDRIIGEIESGDVMTDENGDDWAVDEVHVAADDKDARHLVLRGLSDPEDD